MRLVTTLARNTSFNRSHSVLVRSLCASSPSYGRLARGPHAPGLHRPAKRLSLDTINSISVHYPFLVPDSIPDGFLHNKDAPRLGEKTRTETHT